MVVFAPGIPLSPPTGSHFPVVSFLIYPPLFVGGTTSGFDGFGNSTTSPFSTGGVLSITVFPLSGVFGGTTSGFDGFGNSITSTLFVGGVLSITVFPPSGNFGTGKSTFGDASGRFKSGILFFVGPSGASYPPLLPFFLLGNALAVPLNVPPFLLTSLSTVKLLSISVLIPSNLLSPVFLFPFIVTSPPTVTLSGLIPIVPFPVFSWSIISPTSPKIPPPFVPPLPPTIAPPASKSECTSSTFRSPPISIFPFPVSEPITPPFKFASPSTFTSIEFLAVIPAWLLIESPFLNICPPPAETPISPVTIVFVEPPADKSPPNQASTLDSSTLSVSVTTFKSPPTSRATSLPFTLLPITLVSPPDLIEMLFPVIVLPVLVSLLLSVILNPAFPVAPSWAFPPSIADTPALAVIPPETLNPNEFSLDELCALEIFTSFLASNEISFPSISTPFKLISPSVALKLISPPDLIFVIFSLEDLEFDWLYPSSPVTEVVFPAKSPKITLLTVPATWAAVNPSFICPAWALSAICIPLFTASAIALVVLFSTFTPTVNPLLLFSVSSTYLVLSIFLPVMLKSPPVSKSEPPISTVPPDLIFIPPPDFTEPSVHVVLFSCDFSTVIPTVPPTFARESM